MRFRDNTSLLPGLIAGFVCIFAFDSLLGRGFYLHWELSFAAFLILSVLLTILSHFLTYWELDPACLRERKLWKTKEIAWKDVTRIGRFGFSSDIVKISYGRVPEVCEYILANPCDRDRFIAALRRFVPEANFEVFEPISTCRARKRPEN
jgi:hypothetical protein